MFELTNLCQRQPNVEKQTALTKVGAVCFVQNAASEDGTAKTHHITCTIGPHTLQEAHENYLFDQHVFNDIASTFCEFTCAGSIIN